MRAQSSVSVKLQAPPTIFGMAPTHLLFVMVAAFFAAWFFKKFTISSLSFVIGLGVLIFGVIWAIAKRRADPHCETLLVRPWFFFRQKKVRYLVAGQPLKAKRRKKRAK